MVAAWQLKISGSPPNEHFFRPQRALERRGAASAAAPPLHKGHLMRFPVFFSIIGRGGKGVPATSRHTHCWRARVRQVLRHFGTTAWPGGWGRRAHGLPVAARLRPHARFGALRALGHYH